MTTERRESTKHVTVASRIARICEWSLWSVSVVGLSLCSTLVQAQIKVNVDFSKESNILTSYSMGAAAVMSNSTNFAPGVIPYLRSTGAETLVYPGTPQVADLYQWESHSLASYKGASAPYLAPESDFGHFAVLASQLGGGVVIVNYGSNRSGTGGGDPKQAAAWVAYANANSASTQVIGKGADGTDWHTVGYWAAMRSAAPLAQDDGYNFLRIGQQKPLNLKLWQIGDQLYNNGFYGATHASEPDLHGSIPTSARDLGRLNKNPALAPAAIAQNVALYADAMKAVDPTIKIGVALPTPPEGNGTFPDFTRTMLRKACSAIDYVGLTWTPTALLPPDYKALDEAQSLSNIKNQVGTVLRSYLDEVGQDCPKNHIPQIAFEPATVPTWARREHAVFDTLWLDASYPLLIEAGIVNVAWPELYGDTFLSTDKSKLGPAYYGLQLVHIIAHTPGDMFVVAGSSDAAVDVHATRRRDGVLGVMLVNEDPKRPATVKLSLQGARADSKAKRFDYGWKQQTSGAGLTISDITDFSNDFTITVPPYTVTDLLVPQAK
ncbi:MAG: hypothetical protein HIU93_15575 [Acidobacteria bacterium]|nr:hypothetical protein [Acidobacteriota bacterium]